MSFARTCQTGIQVEIPYLGCGVGTILKNAAAFPAKEIR